MGLVTAVIIAAQFVRRKRRRPDSPLLRWMDWILAGQAVLMIGLAVYQMLSRFQPTGPPFGF
jgi:hypothetical protein